MRKHGYDAILNNAPVGGERKVLEGIKKKKERAKRKRAEGGAEDEEERIEVGFYAQLMSDVVSMCGSPCSISRHGAK